MQLFPLSSRDTASHLTDKRRAVVEVRMDRRILWFTVAFVSAHQQQVCSGRTRLGLGREPRTRAE